MVALKFLNKTHPVSHFKERERSDDQFAEMDVNVDLREVYFLILHFLSAGPCKKTVRQFWDELQEHDLLPRRYHAWYSRSGECNGHGNDDGVSFPLNYDDLVNRYLHIKHDHLVKLLTQVMLTDAPPLRCMDGMSTPSATDVPTLLGTGAFSLLHRCDRNSINRPAKHVPSYLRWPHLQADHIRGLHLREIGGGFPKHHRAPSIRFACYAVAKPSTMVQKMQYVKRLRGHRAAVYCAIFDRSGRYVITGSDDRLVKIWSMETAFCLSSCRGHEGDITDLAVSSNNLLVASASNDYSIRVWRLPDGIPVSVLLGHSGAVTAIAFSPRAGFSSYLLSSSDDGTCRLWDARSSQCRPRIYLPKPRNTVTGNNSGFTSSNAPSSSSAPPLCQILCCAYNASGTVFVTGSSDTYARVWSACRSNTDDPEQPMHEIDLLAGHENDVNYVQFSGCAVASRSSASDITVEENIPKFKNSWFSRDNIVTCSRDGSAIIWTPKSSRYQGKGGRWVRAYHLKVPPPPMPPQPPRGGPRQRLLPTPRGVNMIVWSLDNRYVLAAIMDCRICVWNASDGGLVHCLTGHTASTYVLDVHPFNPRIAMSAGYDGKTILWDIWEGSPIWIYDIGRFKLVDGKFSQDGTSIVLSDDVGQIYLLSTGQGDSQKDAKYDQFFLGDYRPLNQDTHGNVVDQETQLAPHLRNIQDLLCDSSMLPYPEPYQSMYQRRRLGARGIEWRPSSLNFAVGTDGLSQEYQLFPLVDLDMVIERAPDFLDALYMMELENDAIPDETDSEYFLTDESLGEDGQECAILGSSSDSENYGSGNNLRRSKRKKSLAEVEMSTSGRRGKKRIPHERECTSFRNKRNNKSRRKNSSKRNSDKVISLRSQRLGLRSAVNGYSDDTSEISSYEEEQEGSEFDSSDSEPPLSTSITKKKKPADYLNNEKQVFADNKQSSLNDSENAIKCPEQIEPQVNGEKRKKLVLKLSMRKPTASLHLESARIQQIPSGNPHPSSSGISESEHVKDDEELRCNQKIYALVKPCTHQPNPGGYVNPVDLIHGLEGSSSHPVTRNGKEHSEFEDAYHKFSVPIGHGNHGVEAVSEDYRNKSELQNVHETETNNLCCVRSDKKSPLKLSFSLKDYKQAGNASELSSSQDSKEGFKLSTSSELAGSSYHSHESIDIRKPKPTILKFKTKMIMQNSSGEEGPAFHGGDSFGNIVPRVTEGGGGSNSRSKSTVGPSSARNYNHTEYPHIATDAVRRKRSLRLKATSTETNSVSHGFPLSSSRRSEKPMEKPLDRFPNKYSETSKPAVVRFKNNKENDETRHSGDKSAVTVSNMNCPQRKPNWLLLLNQEEGYRYIPQLGDEVVYLAQGHNEYIVRSSKENAESSRSLDNLPLEIFEGRIGAVEVCLVVDLEYSFSVGSAESCCKITLKFTDTSSAMFGVEYKFALRELADFPDFIVVRTRYDVAINRIWSIREKCLVWWKEEDGNSGSWWEGQIVSLKDKSSKFPDSPWERYVVNYPTEPTTLHFHCPWELHDPDSSFEHPQIDAPIRDKLMYNLSKYMKSASRDGDRYGILKLEEVSQEERFKNRFPVPLSLEIVKARLENNYYRSLESMNHDIAVILENASSYSDKDKGLLLKMKKLGDFFNRKFSRF